MGKCMKCTSLLCRLNIIKCKEKREFDKWAYNQIGMMQLSWLYMLVGFILALASITFVVDDQLSSHLNDFSCVANIAESTETLLKYKMINDKNTFELNDLNLNSCTPNYLKESKDLLENIESALTSNVNEFDIENLILEISKIYSMIQKFVILIYVSILATITTGLIFIGITYNSCMSEIKKYKHREGTLELSSIYLRNLENRIKFMNYLYVDIIQVVVIGLILYKLSIFTQSGLIVKSLQFAPLLVINSYKLYTKIFVDK